MNDAPPSPPADEPEPSAPKHPRHLPVQTILIEVFSIVLGVLLALAVNQWREHRAQEARAAAALSNIAQELRSNYHLLTIIHSNNRTVLEAIERSARDIEGSFIPGVQLQSTAWEAARYADVFTVIDYQRVLEISELYAIQEIYRTLGFQLTQAMMNGTAFAAAQNLAWDESAATRRFMTTSELIVSLETQLLETYGNVLAMFDTTGALRDSTRAR